MVQDNFLNTQPGTLFQLQPSIPPVGTSKSTASNCTSSKFNGGGEMTVRIRELQQIQDKHNERLTDLTLSQPHPATGQSPEEMKQWQFWEEWAVKVQAAIAQYLGERKPVVEALHGLHTNIVDMGKAVEITSNILKSWQPHLQFMEVETGKIKEMNEHIQFLNRELLKAQQQLERYQLDDPPTQNQFMELVQACELQKNRWADFDNFCTMEKEATIHRGRKVQSLDLKMTQLANHMEKEVGRLASLIATAPLPCHCTVRLLEDSSGNSEFACTVCTHAQTG